MGRAICNIPPDQIGPLYAGTKNTILIFQDLPEEAWFIDPKYKAGDNIAVEVFGSNLVVILDRVDVVPLTSLSADDCISAAMSHQDVDNLYKVADTLTKEHNVEPMLWRLKFRLMGS